MSELDTTIPGTTPGNTAVMDREAKRDAAKDASKSQLRVLAKGDNRWDDEEYTDEEEAAMIEMYQGTLASIDEGEIVKSKVLEIRDNMVILDIGFKSEGAVPLEEFKDFPDLKAGDEVEVLLEHLEDAEGSVVLSKKKADFMRVWERIRQAYENDLPVEGTLVKKIKGGVVVDLMGVDAFLPGSQIALRRVPNI
ncbi:MAG: S1 RNA-binding domain-containing protein, partial [Gemmatimonadota bacterium]|nr:S1 RNA-binding domain-containing protein [Gemmatimonadota bacterium]